MRNSNTYPRSSNRKVIGSPHTQGGGMVIGFPYQAVRCSYSRIHSLYADGSARGVDGTLVQLAERSKHAVVEPRHGGRLDQLVHLARLAEVLLAHGSLLGAVHHGDVTSSGLRVDGL